MNCLEGRSSRRQVTRDFSYVHIIIRSLFSQFLACAQSIQGAEDTPPWVTRSSFPTQHHLQATRLFPLPTDSPEHPGNCFFQRQAERSVSSLSESPRYLRLGPCEWRPVNTQPSGEAPFQRQLGGRLSGGAHPETRKDWAARASVRLSQPLPRSSAQDSDRNVLPTLKKAASLRLHLRSSPASIHE